MKLNKIIVTGLLVTVAGAAGACEVPKLVVIPTKEAAAGKEEGLRTAFVAYRQGMEAYTTCVQAELAAAGGPDKAPESLKKALIARNNAAVAEVQAMDKLFNENVGGGPVSAGPTQGPPAAKPTKK